MPEKTITIRITDEQHKDIKIKAINKGLSIKNYILELVENDTETKK